MRAVREIDPVRSDFLTEVSSAVADEVMSRGAESIGRFDASYLSSAFFRRVWVGREAADCGEMAFSTASSSAESLRKFGRQAWSIWKLSFRTGCTLCETMFGS